jgi:hypothetical protein
MMGIHIEDDDMMALGEKFAAPNGYSIECAKSSPMIGTRMVEPRTQRKRSPTLMRYRTCRYHATDLRHD